LSQLLFMIDFYSDGGIKMKVEDIKVALKDTLGLYADDVEYAMIENISDEAWKNIVNTIKNELNVVGIKVK